MMGVALRQRLRSNEIVSIGGMFLGIYEDSREEEADDRDETDEVIAVVGEEGDGPFRASDDRPEHRLRDRHFGMTDSNRVEDRVIVWL